jgi:Ca2+-binding EF-hand superfamily protein
VKGLSAFYRIVSFDPSKDAMTKRSPKGAHMKGDKLIVSLLTATLLAGFALASQASENPASPDRKARPDEIKAQMLERFKAADTNGDGMISREEASAGLPQLAKHFDSIDTDKNGLITMQEFEAAMKGLHGPQYNALARLDKDGDGLISRGEAQVAPRLAKHFDEIDTNKDGFLSKDELAAARTKMKDAIFAYIDTDGDGRISREEAARFPRLALRFDQIDANKDGYLTKAELQAANSR